MDATINFTSKMSKNWCQKFKVTLTNARYRLDLECMFSVAAVFVLLDNRGLTLLDLSACGRKVYFDDKSLICLFGEFYLPNETNDEETDKDAFCSSVSADDDNASLQPALEDDSVKSYQQFLIRFGHTFWFTYRQNFKIPLPDDTVSDCGWGCMLRCGQMLMAETLGRLAFSMDDSSKYDRALLERAIIWNFLEHFDDDQSDQPIFSLHRMVEIGQKEHNRQPGDWFAPGATAQILRQALYEFRLSNKENNGQLSDSNYFNLIKIAYNLVDDLQIHVVKDGLLCTMDLDALCGAVYLARNQSASSDYLLNSRLRCVLYSEEDEQKCLNATQDKEWNCPLLLIIPLRLGGETLNSVYVEKLKKLLSLPCCVGLLGGRPKKSHFIFGWHNESVIYLDPHYCHDSLDVSSNSADCFPVDSFFCDTPQKMSFTEMDPSCAVGFFFKGRNELIVFYQELLDVCTFGIGDRESCKHPVFCVLYSRTELEKPRKKSAASTPNKNLFRNPAPSRTVHDETESQSQSNESSNSYVVL